MQVRGFDARSWHRLVTLILPGLTSHAPVRCERGVRTRGGVLFVLYQETGVVRAIHSLRGAVPLPAWAGPSSLEACARALQTRFALAAEVGALEEFYERIGGRLAPRDGAVETVLVVLDALRELVDEGELHVLPAFGRGVPLPPPEVVHRAWDAVLPEGHAWVLMLYDGLAVDTGFVARRRGGTIDLLLGPEAIHRLTGPLGGDFRRDQRVIRAAIAREVAPLACGVFAPTATVRSLLREERAGAWARAIATRDVVVEPMPPWVAVAASAGAVRSVASRTLRVLTGLEVLGLFGPLVSQAREVFGSLDLPGLLGFDPLEVLGLIARRSEHARRDPPEDDEP
jgi:hypothetical protein